MGVTEGDVVTVFVTEPVVDADGERVPEADGVVETQRPLLTESCALSMASAAMNVSTEMLLTTSTLTVSDVWSIRILRLRK